MLRNTLPWAEQDALEAICKHHDVTDPDLVKDLATFVNWTREDEKSKTSWGSPKPPFLISLLGAMGIFGRGSK